MSSFPVEYSYKSVLILLHHFPKCGLSGYLPSQSASSYFLKTNLSSRSTALWEFETCVYSLLDTYIGVSHGGAPYSKRCMALMQFTKMQCPPNSSLNWGTWLHRSPSKLLSWRDIEWVDWSSSGVLATFLILVVETSVALIFLFLVDHSSWD